MSDYVIQKREACPRCNGSGRETGPLGLTKDQADDVTCHMCKDGSVYTEVDLAVALGDFGLIARGGPGD